MAKVKTEWDRVILSVGETDIRMPYAVAFKIALNLSVACKDAMRMVKEDVSQWRGYAKVTDRTFIKGPVNPEARRTLGGKFEWAIKLKDYDERVYLHFGNVEIALHWEKALQLSTAIRAMAVQAKAWAGDGGRAMNAAGSLRDAEKAYKLGLQ